ncbi:hypothetical protein LOK49_LG02G00912 [Camellia lanceoleosa]|uniref:Uncharacterized protein n=1 Tax=Camellia lanceoleosa TaxID=1840588 RepID=A0ACC0IP69_9ERIC|nr:hypothetical protein LOK49_Contig121G00009 [Camellia lanceoleosa]KAI8025946.1 hypothetical protein LOK49_LG02G00912 [Camellia lanceoleosa]
MANQERNTEATDDAMPSSSDYNLSLPMDIIFNILNHLPVKSLLRFRCVTPDVHFHEDLGLDSLDNMQIVMALEEEFKLEIPNKEADKIDSCFLAIE